MKLAIGSDERTHLTEYVVEEVKKRGHRVALFGLLADRQEYWPAIAQQVAELVAAGKMDEGILFCWTGTGVSLAANKVPRVRAALCDDAETAKGSRLWNNANVLCMSLRSTPEMVAKEILDAWFSTEYQPNEEDEICLEQVAAIEGNYSHRQIGCETDRHYYKSLDS